MDRELPLVVLTVGTDHHPFDRLVGWVADSVTAQPVGSVDLFCQHGTAAPPGCGRSDAAVDHRTLERLLASATVVVCHCGPSTVVESRRLGRIPIVVPRLARYGEAVDDHQSDFAHFLAARRLIVLAESEDELRSALDRALADPAAFRTRTGQRLTGATTEAVDRFSELAGAMMPARRTELWRRLPIGRHPSA